MAALISSTTYSHVASRNGAQPILDKHIHKEWSNAQQRNNVADKQATMEYMYAVLKSTADA